MENSETQFSSLISKIKIFFEINKLEQFSIDCLIKDKIQLQTFYKKLKKIILPYTVINNLLENPKNFFLNIKKESKEIMKKYILLDDKNILLFQYFIQQAYDKKIEIYQNNFSIFFNSFSDKLITVNRNLETIFHIVANYHKPDIFFDLFEKLTDLRVISKELILIKNLFDQTCFDIIFSHYFNNRKKNLKEEKFINFFQLIRTKHKEILNNLPQKYQNEIKLKSTNSLVFIEYEKINKKNCEEYSRNLIEFCNSNEFNREFIFTYLIKENIDFSSFNFIYYHCQGNNQILNEMLKLLKKCKEFYKLKDRYLFHHLFFILKHTKNLDDITSKYIINYCNDIIISYLNKGNNYKYLINRRKTERNWNIFHYLFINESLSFSNKKELFDLICQNLFNNNSQLYNKLLQKYDSFGLYPFIFFYMNNPASNNNEKKFLEQLFMLSNITSNEISINDKINIIKYFKYLKGNSNVEIYFKLISNQKLFDFNIFIELIGGKINKINKKIFQLIMKNFITSKEKLNEKNKKNFVLFCQNNLTNFDRDLLLLFSKEEIMNKYFKVKEKINFIFKLIKIALLKKFPEQQLKETFVTLTNSNDIDFYMSVVLEICLKISVLNKSFIKIMKDLFLEKINKCEFFFYIHTIQIHPFQKKNEKKESKEFSSIENILITLEMYIFMYFAIKNHDKNLHENLPCFYFTINNNKKLKEYYKLIKETFKYPFHIIKQIFDKIYSKIFPHDFSIFSKNFLEYEKVGNSKLKESSLNSDFYYAFCDYLLIKYGKRNPKLEEFFTIFYEEYYHIFPDDNNIYFPLYEYIQFFCFDDLKYLQYIENKKYLIINLKYKMLPYVFIKKDKFLKSQIKLFSFISKILIKRIDNHQSYFHFLENYFEFFKEESLENAILYYDNTEFKSNINSYCIELLYKMIFKGNLSQTFYNKILFLLLQKNKKNITLKVNCIIDIVCKNYIEKNEKFKNAIRDNLQFIIDNITLEIESLKNERKLKYHDSYEEYFSNEKLELEEFDYSKYYDEKEFSAVGLLTRCWFIYQQSDFKSEFYFKIMNSLSYSNKRIIMINTYNLIYLHWLRPYSKNPYFPISSYKRYELSIFLCFLSKNSIEKIYVNILRKIKSKINFKGIYENIINNKFYLEEKECINDEIKTYFYILKFIINETMIFKGYDTSYFFSIIKFVFDNFRTIKDLNILLYNLLVQIVDIQYENENKKDTFFKSIFLLKSNKINFTKNIFLPNSMKIFPYDNNLKYDFLKKNLPQYGNKLPNDFHLFEKLFNNGVAIEENFDKILKNYLFNSHNKHINRFCFFYYYFDFFLNKNDLGNFIQNRIFEYKQISYANYFAFLSKEYKNREKNVLETLKQIIENENFKTLNPLSYKIKEEDVKLLKRTNIFILYKNLKYITNNYPNLPEIINQNIVLRNMLLDVLYYSMEKFSENKLLYYRKKEFNIIKKILIILTQNFSFLLTDIFIENERFIILILNIFHIFLKLFNDVDIYSIIQNLFLGNNFINSLSKQLISLNTFSKIIFKLLRIIKTETVYEKLFEILSSNKNKNVNSKLKTLIKSNNFHNFIFYFLFSYSILYYLKILYQVIFFVNYLIHKIFLNIPFLN